MSKYVLFLLAIALVTSCTIEKRVHRPGWHVEWNKRPVSDSHTASAGTLSGPVSAGLIRTADTSATEFLESVAEATSASANPESPEVETPARAPGNQPARFSADTDADTETTASAEASARRNPQQVFAYDPDEIPAKPPVDPIIMAMWILDIVLVILAVLLVTALFASTGTWLLTFGILIYYLIPVVFAANIVLSIIAYDRRRDDPERFRKSPILLALFAGLFCVGGIVLLGLNRLVEKWL